MITCPACSARVRPVAIVYGLAGGEAIAAARRGEIVLGGCCVTADDPEARCPECGTDLRRIGRRFEVHPSVRRCAVCRLPVDADDPDVEHQARDWICGECARARNFDELLWELDAADGDLDGEID